MPLYDIRINDESRQISDMYVNFHVFFVLSSYLTIIIRTIFICICFFVVLKNNIVDVNL